MSRKLDRVVYPKIAATKSQANKSASNMLFSSLIYWPNPIIFYAKYFMPNTKAFIMYKTKLEPLTGLSAYSVSLKN
ncbi:hypothetical protein CXF65_03275 [Psychrobacter sp. Sarcosine-3u-12]|nr:hypothetical protein CXF65_03275 [Psychrobacter sp. Sarcosine-3u-12]